jgi:hypothetical protein
MSSCDIPVQRTVALVSIWRCPEMVVAQNRWLIMENPSINSFKWINKWWYPMTQETSILPE